MAAFRYFHQCISCGKKFQPDKFLYAVALNAVIQARENGIIKENDLVVSVSTASAIKFAESGIKHHKTGSKEDFANPYEIIDGNLEAIEKSFKSV